MLPDLQVKLPRDRARGRDEVDERVLLPEGRVPSPLSRAEVDLGDLGHVGNNFGASWDLGTRGNANFIFQREFSTSAMLLFEVAYPHLKLHVSLFPPLSIIPLWSSLRRARSAVFILRGCVNAISRHALKFLSYRSMVPFRDARLFAKSIRPTNGRGERKRERKRSDVPPPPPRFHGISRRILVGSALFGKVEYFLLPGIEFLLHSSRVNFHHFCLRHRLHRFKREREENKVKAKGIASTNLGNTNSDNSWLQGNRIL